METITKQKITAQEARDAMAEINSLVKELSDTVLTISGKSFPLKDWITVSDYAKQNNVSIARVNNWIGRGIVPADCFIIVPELNYLKLLKNQPYEVRAYETRAQ